MSDTSRWSKSRKHQKQFSTRIKQNNEALTRAKLVSVSSQEVPKHTS